MPSPKLSWDDLRVFLAVHRRGSHGGAARLLGVDPSTIGRRVAALEKALGTRLFDRTPSGIELTTAGAVLLPRASRLEEEALAAERELGGADARLSGTVRLTATDGLLHYLLMPALASLRRTHPGLLLDLRPDTRTLDLSRREADVAVRLYRPKGASLLARRCATIHWALYASHAYLARYGVPRATADLCDHELIGFDESLEPLPLLRWLRRLVPAPRWTVRSTTTTPQVLACIEGAGIAMLPTFIGRNEPRLVPVLPSAQLPSRDTWLVIHQDLRKTARIAAVVQWLQATLQQLEPDAIVRAKRRTSWP